MKKLITVLALSFGLLFTSASITSASNSSIILYVMSTNYDSNHNLYISQCMDENGLLYTVESYDDINKKWLNATITAHGEITGYSFIN